MADQPGYGDDDYRAKLDALRESFADGTPPVRLAYLCGLANRAVNQPEPVRHLLMAKIAHEADQIAAEHSIPAPLTADKADAPAIGPLTELLSYIKGHGVAPTAANKPLSAPLPAQPLSLEKRPTPVPELKSVAYFRNTWSSLSAEQQLTQTLAQAPENAGPMNSQHLVLGSLKFMREHAPDYLQGFMSYVDSLIWLEHASLTKPGSERSATNEGPKKKQVTKRNVGSKGSN